MRNAGSLSAGFLPAICAWATSLTVRPDVRAFARSLWQGRAIVNRE